MKLRTKYNNPQTKYRSYKKEVRPIADEFRKIAEKFFEKYQEYDSDDLCLLMVSQTMLANVLKRLDIFAKK